MRRLAPTFTLLAVLFASSGLLASAAFAHDLPPSEHPATAASEVAAQLLAAQPDDSPAKMQLYSYIASKLTWGAKTLGVCFWNGTPALRAKIAGIANTISTLTPVKFDWGPDGSYRDCPREGYALYIVRLSVTKDSSLLADGDHAEDFFTSIGRSLLTDSRRANVNLPFPSDASDDLFAEKTLHEFCHVLGCLHEHQRGLCDQDFKKDYIKAKFGYSEEQYRENFITIPTSNPYYGAVSIGKFDRDSVMLYSIPAEFFVNPSNSPCYRANPVAQLSSDDQAGLKFAYQSKPDARLIHFEDFQRLTAEFDMQARELHAQAKAFRTTASDWTLNTTLLKGASRTKALLAFAQFAAEAESKAKEAANEADRFRLTPTAEVLLAKLMATLPSDE